MKNLPTLFLKKIIEEDYLKILKLLVKEGVELNCQNKNGETPLHQACRYGNSVAVEFLLQCPNIDTTLLNKFELFLFHFSFEKFSLKLTLKFSNNEDSFSVALGLSQRQMVTNFQREGSRRSISSMSKPKVIVLNSSDGRWVIERNSKEIYDYEKECENLVVELESDLHYKKFYLNQGIFPILIFGFQPIESLNSTFSLMNKISTHKYFLL